MRYLDALTESIACHCYTCERFRVSLRQREPRERDAKHLKYIRSLPCSICKDNTATEAAHIRTVSLENGKRHTGMQEKPSDKWAVPLCNTHHREQHTMNEMTFWESYNIDPFILAISLRERRS